MSSDSAQTELGKYLVNADSANDPTVFWTTQKEFSRLFVIAQQVFAAPASTAAVERAGYILSPRRLRTSDFNFENLLFANLNGHVL